MKAPVSMSRIATFAGCTRPFIQTSVVSQKWQVPYCASLCAILTVALHSFKDITTNKNEYDDGDDNDVCWFCQYLQQSIINVKHLHRN